jgi:hypothetical protein
VKVPRPIKLLGIGTGSLLFLAAVVVVIGYLSAPHFYLTRTIFWGESDHKDLEKFPARTIHNAPPTSRFDELSADNPYASQIEDIAREGTNGSLVDYLESSGTTAFLVIHDDKVFYERSSTATIKPPSTPPSLWPSRSLPHSSGSRSTKGT